MRAKLKQIGSLILALAITLTTIAVPITSNAAAGGDNDGYQYGTSGSQSSSGQAGTRYGESGYRFYIVDENFNCVSNILDFVHDNPREVQTWCTGTYGKPYNAAPPKRWVHKDGNRYLNFDDLQEYCQADTAPPVPFNVTQTDNGGEKFRKWFLKGQEGGTFRPNNTTGGSNTSQSKPAVSESQILRDYQAGTNLYDYIIITDPDIYSMTEIWAAFDCNEFTEVVDKPSIRHIDVAAAHDIFKKATSIKERVYAKYKDTDAIINPFNMTKNKPEIAVGKNVDEYAEAIANYKAVQYIYGYYDNSGEYGIGNMELVGKMAMNMFVGDTSYYEYKVQAEINGDPNATGIWENKVYITEAGTKPVNTDLDKNIPVITIDDILNNEIPLNGTTNYEEAIAGSPAEVMLNNTTIWAMDDLGFKNALDALYTGKYFLIVEPLTCIYMCDSSGYNKIGRIYGTPYNMASYYGTNSAAVNALGRGADNGGWMKRVFHAQYVTMANRMEHPELKLNGTPMRGSLAQPSTTSLRDYLNNMNACEGTGLHIYIGADSGTSTYDEPLGSTPGPSPDDDKRISQEEKDRGFVANIVKFYELRKSDGTVVRTNFTNQITPTKIIIEDEPDYKLTDWFTSARFVPATGTTEVYDQYHADYGYLRANGQSGYPLKTSICIKDENVPAASTETTLYVLLVKDEIDPPPNGGSGVADGMWTLEESEISKGVEVTSLPTTQLNWWFSGHSSHNGHYCSSKSCTSCGGCHCSDEDCTGCCTGCYCPGTHGCSWSITDSSLTFRVKNDFESMCDDIIALQSGYGTYTKDVSATRTDTGEHELKSSGHVYKFTLYRGMDKLTQAGYASGDASVSDLGFNTLSIKPRPTRLSVAERFELPIILKCNSSDILTKLKCSYVSTEEESKGIFMKNQAGEVFVDGSALIKVYSGIQKKTHKAPDSEYAEIKTYSRAAGVNESGRRVETGTTIEFNPYIRMTTAKVDSNGNYTAKKNVNVLSEWLREIIPDDYAEVEFTEHPENLKVQSQMWALDAGLTNGSLGWNKPNQVLKGGAAYQLSTKDNNQSVRVTTYQTILSDPSDARWQLGGNPNQVKLQTAKDNHDNFVNTVIDSFSSLNVQLWINKDPNASYAWEGGMIADRGADVSDLRNNNVNGLCSTETKYYLNHEGSPSDSASDAQSSGLYANIASKSTVTYTIKADIKGEVTVTGTNGVSIRFGKSEDISSISSKIAGTPFAKVEARVNILEKVLSTIERNSGNDSTASWASDGRWYNEAVDGIQVVVQTTNLSVGFDRQTQLRTTVLDPKLVPYIESKDAGTREAFLLQYKCENTCGNQTAPLVVGQFKGKDISMINLDKLFTSRKFYITDGTVQNSR